MLRTITKRLNPFAISRFNPVVDSPSLVNACCVQNVCPIHRKISTRMKWKSVQILRDFSTSKSLYHPELSSNDYEMVADETLDSLTEFFEDLPERLRCDNEYDTSYGSGVLTVKISDKWGTYVINKQTPNKQIWLSSPKSGPKRYDFVDGSWVYKHDGRTIHQLLTEEISEAIGTQVDCTDCAYSKQGIS